MDFEGLGCSTVGVDVSLLGPLWNNVVFSEQRGEH